MGIIAGITSLLSTNILNIACSVSEADFLNSSL